MAKRAKSDLMAALFPALAIPPREIRTTAPVVITTLPVGKVKALMRQDDIELVQFLLCEFFDSPGISGHSAIRKIPSTSRGEQAGETVAVDGVYGNQTIVAIDVYQREFLKQANPDGIVSVAQTAGPVDRQAGGANITPDSYSRARTITSLASHWAVRHPGADMADALKVQKFAPHLAKSLAGTRILPVPTPF